jgi:FdhE protein
VVAEFHPRFEVLVSEVGAPKQGLMNIGEEAKPPFAVLPAPSSLFLNRSKRLTALASGHELAPYLTFLAALTRAQHEIVQALPPPVLPSAERVGQALAHGMPPIARAAFEPDEVVQLTIDRLLARLAEAQVPAETAAAIQAVRAASPDARRGLVLAALEDAAPADELAQRVLVAAGLQVHFARLAATLVADDLRLIADGVCPACGSAPMTSSVVGWPKAHNTRFCTCSLCATMWHVVRIKCVLCSTTGGIGYRVIEGKPDTVKAETCDSCRAYVKILYQVNEQALEPLADDVATLGLDMLMAEDGWRRGGQNPFLLGY